VRLDSFHDCGFGIVSDDDFSIVPIRFESCPVGDPLDSPVPAFLSRQAGAVTRRLNVQQDGCGIVHLGELRGTLGGCRGVRAGPGQRHGGADTISGHIY
jgi:hypothetical protein